jgi:hypothetical protein
MTAVQLTKARGIRLLQTSPEWHDARSMPRPARYAVYIQDYSLMMPRRRAVVTA